MKAALIDGKMGNAMCCAALLTIDDSCALRKRASLVQRVALLVPPDSWMPETRAAGSTSPSPRGSTKLTERLRAKRRPAKALSAAAEPPAPKHRVDEKGACRYRKRARGGRQVNGVKALALGSSYEQMPAGTTYRVYLIHRMPDISTSPDAPSPGQSRSLIRPRGRSLRR